MQLKLHAADPAVRVCYYDTHGRNATDLAMMCVVQICLEGAIEVQTLLSIVEVFPSARER